ncbi:MAG: hypothetical protein IPL25_16595 [Saprospiraceae bacterium]|nr:hypothetical protein [Candidatus Vicinibacter affinis]
MCLTIVYGPVAGVTNFLRNARSKYSDRRIMIILIYRRGLRNFIVSRTTWFSTIIVGWIIIRITVKIITRYS